MYIGVCKAVTDKQIREAAKSGAEDLWDLRRDLGVGSGCGSCKDMASKILSESRQARKTVEPVTYYPAPA